MVILAFPEHIIKMYTSPIPSPQDKLMMVLQILVEDLTDVDYTMGRPYIWEAAEDAII